MARAALERLVRRPGALAAAAVLAAVACSRCLLYFADPYAVGNDGYYYALQLAGLAQRGALPYPDLSPAYWLLLPFSWLCAGDQVLACKLAGIAAALAATGLFLPLARRAGLAWPAALVGGLFFGLSRCHLALDAEFLKNALGVVAWMAFLLCLGRRRPTAALAALAACLVLHQLAFALALASGGLYLWFRADKAWARLCLAGAAAAGLAAAAALAGPRLGALWSAAAPVERFQVLFAGPFATPAEKAEFAWLHLAPLVLFLVARRRPPGHRRSLDLAMAWLGLALAFPWLPWSWDGLSYRLLLAAWVPGAWALAAAAQAWVDRAAAGGRGPEVGRGPAGAAPIALLCAALVLPLAGDARALHEGRYPDYAAAAAAVAALPPLPTGYRGVVARRGLAPFVWYHRGMPAMSYAPDSGDGEWLRLVRGVGAAALAPYCRGGEFAPRALAPGYALADERCWRRAAAARAAAGWTAPDPDNPGQGRPALARSPRPDWFRVGALQPRPLPNARR